MNLEDSKVSDAQRRDFIANVAAKITLGLRRSMSRNGIRQIPDFVNGIVFAGLLLEKNMPGEGGATFVDSFEKDALRLFETLQGEAFAKDLREIRRHEVGVTDQSPTEMLVTAGLSAESTIRQITEEQGLDRDEVLEATVGVIVAAIASDPQAGSDTVKDIVAHIREKTSVWDKIIPSDEEMGLDDFE